MQGIATCSRRSVGACRDQPTTPPHQSARLPPPFAYHGPLTLSWSDQVLSQRYHSVADLLFLCHSPPSSTTMRPSGRPVDRYVWVDGKPPFFRSSSPFRALSLSQCAETKRQNVFHDASLQMDYWHDLGGASNDFNVAPRVSGSLAEAYRPSRRDSRESLGTGTEGRL
jgi:hypothetical protein